MANDIPTAAYGRFDNEAAALAYVREQGAPIVIKADGLAAGKGVVVAETVEDAEAAVRACFDGAFGDAGSTVVIEECMTGPECSLLCFVTAGQSFPMAPAQDHKRAYDGDLGPNTGGMGVYSPVPIVTDEEMAAMVAIMEKAAAATARRALRQRLPRHPVRRLHADSRKARRSWSSTCASATPRPRSCCPVWKATWWRSCSPWPRDDPRMCSWSGPTTGPFPWCSPARAIRAPTRRARSSLGIEEAEELPGVTVFHAGTRRNYDGELLTNGGRVLNVVAKGDSFEEARERAYEACDLINFEGKMYPPRYRQEGLAGPQRVGSIAAV